MACGSLTINAGYKHGIVSKDDLVITGGVYNITAVGGGLYGKDCVKILDGTFNLNVERDGIQSDNEEDADRGFVYIAGGTYDITAGHDGIQAETLLKVAEGTIKYYNREPEAWGIRRRKRCLAALEEVCNREVWEMEDVPVRMTATEICSRRNSPQR